jgi:transposase-like protein
MRSFMEEKEAKNEFIQLRSDGVDMLKISQILNMPEETLYAWSNEFRNEIQNAKSASKFYHKRCK